MEYTKDLILKVHYDDDVRFKVKKWTSRLFYIFKEHKLLTISLVIFLIFVLIDIVLVVNFFNILKFI